MADSNSKILPTFSVVIPLYQKRHRIEACLESVRAQTTPPFEVIVVDDGSTDGGGELVKAIGVGWIRYIRQENQGVSAARNQGIALAQGSYVAFLDADDTWSNDHIETLTILAKKYRDAPIIGTNWSENGKISNASQTAATVQTVDLECFLRNTADGSPPYWTSAVSIKKCCIGEEPLFPVGSRIAEDQDAWLQLLAKGCGFKSSKVTAHYHDDILNSWIAKAKHEDFDSMIFCKWSKRVCYPSSSYWRFVASHRLYTIERHIGYTDNNTLLRCLIKTKSNLITNEPQPT